MKADLHLHTTVSDGTLTPGEIVKRAAAQGFGWIAVTDHDSIEGVAAAQEAGNALGVNVIPAAELSCGLNREIHILGYGFDPQNEALGAYCRRRRESRIERCREMCRLMTQLGKPIRFERVLELADGVIGRPHVARAMVEAGHVKTVQEAFDRFLKPGKPGFVPRESVMAQEAIGVITKAGGVAVLAHPMELKMGEASMESLVLEWKAQGLGGLEVYHPSAANNHAATLLKLARREGLLVTGGSDYHGDAGSTVRIGRLPAGWPGRQNDFTALESAISRL